MRFTISLGLSLTFFCHFATAEKFGCESVIDAELKTAGLRDTPAKEIAFGSAEIQRRETLRGHLYDLFLRQREEVIRMAHLDRACKDQPEALRVSAAWYRSDTGRTIDPQILCEQLIDAKVRSLVEQKTIVPPSADQVEKVKKEYAALAVREGQLEGSLRSRRYDKTMGGPGVAAQMADATRVLDYRKGQHRVLAYLNGDRLVGYDVDGEPKRLSAQVDASCKVSAAIVRSGWYTAKLCANLPKANQLLSGKYTLTHLRADHFGGECLAKGGRLRVGKGGAEECSCDDGRPLNPLANGPAVTCGGPKKTVDQAVADQMREIDLDLALRYTWPKRDADKLVEVKAELAEACARFPFAVPKSVQVEANAASSSK